MRFRSLVPLALLLAGCSTTTEIGKSQTDAAFPQRSQADVEAELKKDPAAWAAYQESQRKNAAYEAAGKSGR